MEVVNNINQNRQSDDRPKPAFNTPPSPFENDKQDETPKNTLGDDIIDKYVDESNKDMYTLNVKKNSGKKK